MNSIQNIRLLSALIVIALAVGCDAPDETGPLTFEDRTFAPSKVGIRSVGAEHRLSFSGTVDHAPVELYLDLQLDDIMDTVGATHHLGGETFFDTENFARFIPFEEHAAPIFRIYAMGVCNSCDFDGDWQLVTGTLTIDSLTESRIGGRISIIVEGDIPLANGLRNIRTFISGPFEAPLASKTEAGADPVESAPEVDPQSDQPMETAPSAPTTSQDSAPKGPDATAVSPIYEATLYDGWGVNLATGETFKKANFANSDLYATAGHPYLKLTPGGTSPTQGQPLRWFKNSGGFVKSFGAITEVPLELPTADDGSQSIVSAKPYMGFIVKANLTDVYARVWIRSADPHALTIEYQLIGEAK